MKILAVASLAFALTLVACPQPGPGPTPPPAPSADAGNPTDGLAQAACENLARLGCMDPMTVQDCASALSNPLIIQQVAPNLTCIAAATDKKSAVACGHVVCP
jgi:hypothetical protein